VKLEMEGSNLNLPRGRGYIGSRIPITRLKSEMMRDGSEREANTKRAEQAVTVYGTR
jgi:hypothetical protein